MSRTTLQDLREHLFDTIERLKEGNDPNADPKDTIDIKRAKAIREVAAEIVASAKVEVDAIRILAKADNPDNTRKMLANSNVINIVPDQDH